MYIYIYIEMATCGDLEGNNFPHAALAAAQYFLRAPHPASHSLGLGDVCREKGLMDSTAKGSRSIG